MYFGFSKPTIVYQGNNKHKNVYSYFLFLCFVYSYDLLLKRYTNS